MSILLRLVLAWLALAWSGSAAAPDSEALFGFGGDTVLAAAVPLLRRAADAARYLLLLLLLALPAGRTRH